MSKAAQMCGDLLMQRRVESHKPHALVQLREVHAIDAGAHISIAASALWSWTKVDYERTKVGPLCRALLYNVVLPSATRHVFLERSRDFGKPNLQLNEGA